MRREFDEYVLGLLQKHSSRGVLLDSNLLVVLVIGRANPFAIARFAHGKQYNMDEFGLLDRFVRLFARIITTPHILTEVSNLGGRVQDSDLSSFRTRLGQEIELCDERNCEAKSAAHGPLFLKLGLTDAAVARIAEQGPLVLTDDLPLAGALGKTGIDVLNFNWLRPLAWRR